MPFISIHKYRWHGEIRDLRIKYNQKKKFFADGAPEGLDVETDIMLDYYETEAKLIAAFDKAVAKHHENSKKSRKVIMYKIDTTADLGMNRVSKGSWQGHKAWMPSQFERNSSMALDGCGFTIEWKILMEITIVRPVYYSLNDEGAYDWKDDKTDGFICIDWTKQREQAFKEIEIQMENMVSRLCKILGDPKKTMALLDSGVRLLPTHIAKGE